MLQGEGPNDVGIDKRVLPFLGRPSRLDDVASRVLALRALHRQISGPQNLRTACIRFASGGIPCCVHHLQQDETTETLLLLMGPKGFQSWAKRARLVVDGVSITRSHPVQDARCAP